MFELSVERRLIFCWLTVDGLTRCSTDTASLEGEREGEREREEGGKERERDKIKIIIFS